MTGQLQDAPLQMPNAHVSISGDDVAIRWSAARPFLVSGFLCIIAGGMVAAVTRPTGFEHGSWLAAYLVLVGGAAQIALGSGQAWCADPPPRRAGITVELATWNLGSVAVVVGTLGGAPLVTTVGAIAIIGAIALFLHGVQRTRATVNRLAVVYRATAVIVLISSPVGIALTWIRHG